MKRIVLSALMILLVSCAGKKSDVEVLTDFYKAVLGETEMTDELLKKSLSPGTLENLWETDYEGTYSWWNFRTGRQDGPSKESSLESIESLGDGWYQVTYSDLGIRAATDVRMENGKIADYRPSRIMDLRRIAGTLENPLPAAALAAGVLEAASAGAKESAPERMLQAMEPAAREPLARYVGETGDLWLTSSAIQGTGVAVEWLYQLRFNEEGRARVIHTVDPYEIQQQLCQRMGYSIEGQQITLYDNGREIASATNTVSGMGGFDDESPLWIGEQIQYDLGGTSPRLLVTPGVKFTTGLVLIYDDMPTLSAPLAFAEDGSVRIGMLETDGHPYEGTFLDEDNKEPNLTVSYRRNDGRYDVRIGIFRLASFDDGVGTEAADGLRFTATDPAGNPIGGVITLSGNTATVTFTDTTWSLMEKGAQFKYVRDRGTIVRDMRIITAEKAYQGVSRYCRSEYDWSAAEDNPSIMSVEMGEETDSTYLVVFRSYTGARVYFHVDKTSGSTRMVESVPALGVENEVGTINLFDYLD